MKRLLAVVALAGVLGLSGCGLDRDDIDGMVKLKTECEDAGGVFSTWLAEGGWFYECDLSTVHTDGSGT